MVFMRKTSLAYAKAHLSAIVDAVEHRGKSLIILRHGKPAAAIVPVEVARPVPTSRRESSGAAARASARRFVAEFSSSQPGSSAVDDLRRGRR
jgi:prevent-host-death family protein